MLVFYGECLVHSWCCTEMVLYSASVVLLMFWKWKRPAKKELTNIFFFLYFIVITSNVKGKIILNKTKIMIDYLLTDSLVIF